MSELHKAGEEGAVTEEEAFRVFTESQDEIISVPAACLAIAREAERRLLAKLRAVPAPPGGVSWEQDFEDVRAVLLAAVEHVEE